MSDFVAWIAAEAEYRGPGNGLLGMTAAEEEKTPDAQCETERVAGSALPAHSFPARMDAASVRDGSAVDRNPDLWLYRKRTTGLLRRYMRLSLEAGRLPSVIGREFFRAKITSYAAVTFEDRVIFVHDVEACLRRLNEFDQEMIARVVLQEHDHEQAARLIHCTRKTIERRMPDLIDEVSEEFLRVGILEALPKKDAPELAKPLLT